MSENDLLTEQCGSMGVTLRYRKAGPNKITISKSTSALSTFYKRFVKLILDIVLPYGYPSSVSEDYLQYQTWDTIQAFCSTITGAFTTRAIFQGVGVGNVEATTLSAAVTWILKDGTGMMGRIVFAWYLGRGLDCDCKKWRLFADFLNDLAMFLELLLPYFTGYTMQVLCVTTGMKSIVGVAGGATRAAITQHQAIKNNMADVAAKDGSQETVVNLIASFVSILLLNLFEDNTYSILFIVFVMVIHLLANYLAVRSLVFRNLNDQRIAVVIKSYFNVGTVPAPVKANSMEYVILGFGHKIKSLSGFKIEMGESLENNLITKDYRAFKIVLDEYSNCHYFIMVNLKRRIVNVYFELNETSEDVIIAYFHAACLAIALSVYNGLEQNAFDTRQRKHSTPIVRLNRLLKNQRNERETLMMLPENILSEFNTYVNQEISMFKTAIQVNEWTTDSHALKLGEWRTSRSSSKKQS